MQTPLMVDTDSEPTPKGVSEAQLIKSVPCLLLRVSKKGIITVSIELISTLASGRHGI
jgi:hypothetical protein